MSRQTTDAFATRTTQSTRRSVPDCTGDGLARSVGVALWGSRDGERRQASTIENREPVFHTAYGGRNHASGES